MIKETDTFSASLKNEIQRYITEYATNRANYYLEEYVKDLKGKMREAAAKACIEIFKVMTMERSGDCLQITIKDLSKDESKK